MVCELFKLKFNEILIIYFILLKILYQIPHIHLLKAQKLWFYAIITVNKYKIKYIHFCIIFWF